MSRRKAIVAGALDTAGGLTLFLGVITFVVGRSVFPTLPLAVFLQMSGLLVRELLWNEPGVKPFRPRPLLKLWPLAGLSLIMAGAILFQPQIDQPIFAAYVFIVGFLTLLALQAMNLATELRSGAVPLMLVEVMGLFLFVVASALFAFTTQHTLVFALFAAGSWSVTGHGAARLLASIFGKPQQQPARTDLSTDSQDLEFM